jgi:hypothetical protein
MWGVTRAGIVVLAMFGADVTGTPDLIRFLGTPMTSLWAVVASTVLVLVDLGRRKETMLLRNLGVAPTIASFVAVVPGACVETGWHVLR